MSKSGGSGGSTVTKWEPNVYQEATLGDPANPASKPNTVLGNLLGDRGYMWTSNTLRNGAMNQLDSYWGSDLANYDFGNANNIAQGYIGVGQNNLQSLANGNLSSGILGNIRDSLQPQYSKAVGGVFQNAADRGILNSSLTQAGLNDANKSYADAWNQQAQNWMGTLGQANNNLINNSVAGIRAAAGAQDAATAQPLGLLNGGIGAYNTAQSVLGQGGSQTSTNKSGSMHGSDWLGLGLNVAAMLPW